METRRRGDHRSPWRDDDPSTSRKRSFPETRSNDPSREARSSVVRDRSTREGSAFVLRDVPPTSTCFFPSRTMPRVRNLRRCSSFGTQTGSNPRFETGIERGIYPFRPPIESGVFHVMPAPGSTSVGPIRTKAPTASERMGSSKGCAQMLGLDPWSSGYYKEDADK